MVTIAFTKDWDDVPTCTTHILRELARSEPVLWVGSIGTRKPSAFSGKDLRRLFRRIRRGLQPPEHKENQLYVLYPLLIPKAGSRWAVRLNRWLFGWYVARFMRQVREPNAMGAGASPGINYWCFVPNAVDLLPANRSGYRVIYYVADDWTAFHNLDRAWMRAKENALVARSDVMFGTSRWLVEKLARLRGELRPDVACPVVYMPHGVDHAAFARALDCTLPLPPDLAAVPRPVVGFYGNLHPWVDFALIAALARARPNWSFVLIGENYAAPEALVALPNVHVMGRREHAVLPDYCRGFDVALIPYDMTQSRMESVNPVKTKELLSAGVPLVASAVPELAGYGEDVLCCRDLKEWLEALERQIVRGAEERVAISERMQGETWPEKVQLIREAIAPCWNAAMDKRGP